MRPWKRLALALENVSGPAKRLEKSLQRDGWLVPFGAVADDASEQATDALLQRFQQVSDLALRKILPVALAAFAGRPATMPFRDLLDMLERAGGIASADWWEELNELRNLLFHEYAMSIEERAMALNDLWRRAPILLAEIDKLRVESARRIDD